jgi:UDP-glucose 4-epimerase
MRVVVTGATGNVGTAVVRALVADPAVDDIVGIARRPPSYRPAKVRWHAADVSCDPLAIVSGADAVIHLAWKLQPQHREDELAATNLTGTRRVVDAVVEHQVPAVIVASSVGTYAPGPKDRAVDEAWPATGVPTSSYSRHKAEVEGFLDATAGRAPELRIVRLRTSLVFQRAAASEIARIFVGPYVPRRLPGPLRFVPAVDRLRLQATHADDVAEAYRLALRSEHDGAFNIAAEGHLDPDVIAGIVGGRTIPLPPQVLRAVMDLSHRCRVQRSEPGWLDLARQTPIMDVGRARSALGWTARRTATEAFGDLLAGLGEGAGSATEPLHPRRRGRMVDPET